MFLFRPIATSKSYEYTGFPLEEFFGIFSMLSNDSVTISHRREIQRQFVIFRRWMLLDTERYSLKKDSRDWKVLKAIEDVQINRSEVVFQR